MVLTFSCAKEVEEDYHVSIISAQATDHKSAEINVRYRIEGTSAYTSGGLCWAEDSIPDLDDIIETDSYQYTETDNFFLEDLYANQTYVARGFLKKNGTNEVLYSDAVTFQTPTIPEPPCTVNAGNMNFNSIAYAMEDLVVTESGSTFHKLETFSSIGDIEFYFKEEPRTGIYSTENASFPYVEEGKVKIIAHLTGPWGSWNCVFETGMYNEIYVTNNDGIITIAFCNLTLVADSACTGTPFSYTLEGKLTN